MSEPTGRLTDRRSALSHSNSTVFDRLQTFTLGPVIALVDTCGFSAYDDQSLWHHAVQTYLQLCVRYPELTEGKVGFPFFHALVGGE